MKALLKRESGEVMLEGMIVMVITLLMIVWILGVGFLYYQKYTVRIVTNDAARKVASTYDVPESDIIMGYVSAENVGNKVLKMSDTLTHANKLRAESYVKYVLDKTNFYGTVQDVSVTVTPTADALGRSHVKVMTVCTFKTPFGAALRVFGMSEVAKYSVTAYADSTSLTDYISTVSLADAFTDGRLLSGTGFVEKTVKMINSLMSTSKQLKG